MAEIFAISDTHLGHKNILKFTKSDGSKLREFRDLDHMHNTIIENWCKIVRPQDHVYHCGDVCFDMKYMDIFASLPGHKRLILGNHDLFDIGVYQKYFQKIFGVRQINGVWLSHVPMHQDSVDAPRVKCNIHGHLHAGKVNHPKYFNASVECINYTPISIDAIKSRMNVLSD